MSAPSSPHGVTEAAGSASTERILHFPESVVRAAVDALKEVAVDDFKSERFAKAAERLGVALSLDATSHVLYSNRCTAWLALEQYDRAMADADECIRLQPAWAKGYLRRGSVLYRLGALDDAEAALREGLRLEPDSEPIKLELERVVSAIAERMARQVPRPSAPALQPPPPSMGSNSSSAVRPS